MKNAAVRRVKYILFDTKLSKRSKAHVKSMCAAKVHIRKAKENMNNVRLIAFDLDGTLIDSLGVWDKVDEILASEIARVDYSDLDLPRFREISLAQNSQIAIPYEAFCGEL